MKPILFNTEMVRAILEGRKTVTRRVVKNKSNCTLSEPYQVNDILYVRETWGCYTESWGDAAYFMYRASFPDGATKYINSGVECDLPKWRPSIHMPREAARIFLRVKSVRVERLQDMTREDMLKEGIMNYCENCKAPFGCDLCSNESAVEDNFFHIWNSTIKKEEINTYGWYANPYVWVIEFERISREAAVQEVSSNENKI